MKAIDFNVGLTYAQWELIPFPNEEERKGKKLPIDQQFIKEEYALVNGKNLTDMEKRIFSIIHSMSNREEGCTLTNLGFGIRLEKKEKNVGNAISNLIEKGVVYADYKKTREGTERTLFSVYRLFPNTPVWISNDRQEYIKESIYRKKPDPIKNENQTKKKKQKELLKQCQEFLIKTLKIKFSKAAKSKKAKKNDLQNVKSSKTKGLQNLERAEAAPFIEYSIPQSVSTTPDEMESMHSTISGTEIRVHTINTHKKENKRANAQFSKSISKVFIESIKTQVVNANEEYKGIEKKEEKILEKWSEEDENFKLKTLSELMKQLLFIRDSEFYKTNHFWQAMEMSISTLYSYRGKISSTYEALIRIEDKKKKSKGSGVANPPIPEEEKKPIKVAATWENFITYINSLNGLSTSTREYLVSLKIKLEGNTLTILDPIDKSKATFIIGFFRDCVKEQIEVVFKNHLEELDWRNKNFRSNTQAGNNVVKDETSALEQSLIEKSNIPEDNKQGSLETGNVSTELSDKRNEISLTADVTRDPVNSEIQASEKAWKEFLEKSQNLSWDILNNLRSLKVGFIENEILIVSNVTKSAKETIEKYFERNHPAKFTIMFHGGKIQDHNYEKGSLFNEHRPLTASKTKREEPVATNEADREWIIKHFVTQLEKIKGVA
ncbi:helix-turn-helix domain-containing protein [Leptospira sanjuanensis]|uniref:helix-turn-helix domain-containing protein n=1 Tax=Leptospira sanjuanensis TaxID=2879643 RepID=UPI001EE86A21|nr:helix-turn-helix domain-containing protein [Leptospira sanjuanensis]MCG6170268.1 helix-turn-helix domain-containing protein [Leptospira sanjuanensis]